MTSHPVPLSVLDLVLTSEGDSVATTLEHSVDLARRVEEFGYGRYWLAEHHLFPGGAGAASYLLAPVLARETTSIRLGTAVMIIDNYSPLHVAEIAGTIAELGGRGFDLGIGRAGPSPEQRAKSRDNNARIAAGEVAIGPVKPSREIDGVTIPSFSVTRFNDTRAALNERLLARSPGAPADFEGQVRDVLGFIEGDYVAEEGVEVVASPAHRADVDVWVHGSSPGLSASVAGSLGLPFGANYHNFPQLIVETVAAYRAAFVPSVRLQKPHVIVSVDVLVAETDEEAARIGSPFAAWMYIVREEYAARPFLSPEAAAEFPWDDERQATVADRLESRLVGSPETVVRRLRALAELTGADELLITTTAHAHDDRVNSYRLLAEAWASA